MGTGREIRRPQAEAQTGGRSDGGPEAPLAPASHRGTPHHDPIQRVPALRRIQEDSPHAGCLRGSSRVRCRPECSRTGAPTMRTDLRISRTTAGLHLSAVAAAVIVGGLSVDLLACRWGRRHLFWLGGATMSLGGIAIALGGCPAITLLGALLVGIGGSGTLNAARSSLSAVHGHACLLWRSWRPTWCGRRAGILPGALLALSPQADSAGAWLLLFQHCFGSRCSWQPAMCRSQCPCRPDPPLNTRPATLQVLPRGTGSTGLRWCPAEPGEWWYHRCGEPSFLVDRAGLRKAWPRSS